MVFHFLFLILISLCTGASAGAPSPINAPQATLYRRYYYSSAQLREDVARGFRLILVVDRSPSGQTVQAYRNGQLIEQWDASTAIEGKKFNKSKRRWVKTHTPLGRFRMGAIHKTWDSYSWDEELPYFVRFGESHWGIGFHAVNGPKSAEALGRRDSAGCVRLPLAAAIQIYMWAKKERASMLVIVHDPSL